MQVDLSPVERDLLIRLVEHAVSYTRVEVRRTANPEFHDRLAAEERDLAGLLARLRESPVT